MKDTYIRVRLSDREKEVIRKAAEKLQMTMSEYIVYLVRKEEAKNEKE